MNWLLLTFLAITSRAFYSIGTRLLGRDVKVTPQTQSFLLSSTSGVLSIFLSPLVGGISIFGINRHLISIIFILLASVFGNIIYFKGQKHLDAGTTQIAFSSILIWGTILSIFILQSKFSLHQFLGILLMMGALLLVQSRKSKVHLNLSILYIIISAFLFAVYQVVSASVSVVISTGTYLLIIFLGTAIIIFMMYMNTIKADYKKLTIAMKKNFMITIFASGFSLLYNIFAFLAYRVAPNRGAVVVLLTAQVVLSVIFGMIFLKEKDNMPKKILAGFLAFLAGVLIKS